MRRNAGIAVFLASLGAGLFSFAHAEFHFYPPDNPDGLNCLFRPISPASHSEASIGDHPASEGNVAFLVGDAWLSPARIAKARKVFHHYGAEYRVDVDDGLIYMPCKYYSDPSFLLTITINLFAPGDFSAFVPDEKK